MARIEKFEIQRKRGIVWVCDIANSSKNLNRNDAAESTEQFLQRFLYVALVAAEASGGEFIKWTGDGFLAWYEVELDRNLGDIAAKVVEAAWYLTALVNVTQLAVKSPVKFHIRHAITYEKDAVVIDLAHSGTVARDVLGRGVVLAFRTSSITAEFPGIVTQREVVQAVTCSTKWKHKNAHFIPLKLSKADKTRYFKGETWGTKDLYRSVSKKPKPSGAGIRKVEKLIATIETRIADKQEPSDNVGVRIFADMQQHGDPWAKTAVRELDKFIHDELFVPLKEILGLAKAQQKMNQP